MNLKDRLGDRYNKWLFKTHNENYTDNSTNKMIDELIDEIDKWLMDSSSLLNGRFNNMIDELRSDLR